MDKDKPQEWYPCIGERSPRLESGRDVREQETYGCDFVTGRDAVQVLAEALPEFHEDYHWEIYSKLMNQVNESYGKMTPDTLATQSLALAAEDLVEKLERENLKSPSGAAKNLATSKALWTLSRRARENPNLFVVHRKGYGVVNIRERDIQKGEFVIDFLGEIYPPWAWMEKQDAVKKAQQEKRLEEIGAPEFYNMQMERPGGDRHAFGLLFCDAMHYNNFAARMSHSCEPNVQVILTVVDGKYEIHFYATREIQKGEELCYNYHSCSDSMKEVEAAFCLCGAKKCRGSYLTFVGENNNAQVFEEEHRLFDRCTLLLNAIDEEYEDNNNNISEAEHEEKRRTVRKRLESIGFRLDQGVLAGAPKWLTNYISKVAFFIDFEREKLPTRILLATKEYHEKRRKRGFNDNFTYDEKNAVIEAMAMRENRIQALAVCVSKVRRLLTLGEGFDSPKYGKSPPPFSKLSGKKIIEKFWFYKPELENNRKKHEQQEPPSIAKFLKQTITAHSRRKTLSNAQREKYLAFLSLLEFKSKEMMDACGSEDEDDTSFRSKNHNALVWLRDALLDLPVTPCARHDLCADIIHLFASTENLYVFNVDAPCYQPQKGLMIDVREDEMMAFGVGAQAASHEIASSHQKTYKKDFATCALLTWHKQDLPEPTRIVHSSFKGCAVLPDISCCYGNHAEAKAITNGDDLEVRSKWLSSLIERSDSVWDKNCGPWGLGNVQKLIGSPMLDQWRKRELGGNSTLNDEILDWLRTRMPSDLPQHAAFYDSQNKVLRPSQTLYESGRLQEIGKTLLENGAEQSNFLENINEEEVHSSTEEAHARVVATAIRNVETGNFQPAKVEE